MANTYYKYAEREADSYINWAEIGKNMSDMLANENKVREEKKAALDEASRQFGIQLANAPQGQSKLMNEWALKFAGDAQSARLMQDKLLKSGQLKLNDYLIMRQNITDGTTQAFDLSKEYQAEFENKWNRMKNDESQDAEQWLMAEAESFGNFNETQLYINPTDGKVSVAYKELGPDGVYRMSSNPNKFTDINALRNRIKGTYDKYNVDANMETYVKGLGKELNSLVKVKNSLGATGLVSETLDITNRKNLPKDLQNVVMTFEQAETKALQGQLANPWNTSSILTNSLDVEPTTGKPYTFTWDEADAKSNPEKILLKNKSTGAPVPQFSAEQEKQALEYLRLQARLRYDKEEKVISTPQVQLQERRPRSAAEMGAQEKQEMAKNFAQNLVYILTGDAAKSDAGTKYLTAKSGIKVIKGKNSITVTDDKGKSQEYKFEVDGTIANPQLLVKSFIGSVNTLGLNEDDVLKYFDQLLPKGATLNRETEAVGYEVETAPTKVDYTDKVKEQTATNNQIIIPNKATETANNLTAKFKGLGFTFIPNESTVGTTDQIVIEAKNGKKSKPINVDNLDNLEIINAFIEENYDPASAAKLFKSKSSPAPAATTKQEVAKGNAKNAGKNLNATLKKQK